MASLEQYTAAYTAATEKLLDLAQRGGGSSSMTAALILLSASNGYSWHVSIPDLCSFDSSHFHAAITVITGRYLGLAEPNQLVPDGDELFRGLWDQWERFNRENRWKYTCDDCDGLGYIFLTDHDCGSDQRTPCRRCDETGMLAEVKGVRAKVIDNMQ